MGKSGCVLGWRPERAGSGGNWPVGGRETAGGRRSRTEGEEELDRSGQVGPGLWGDLSPWGSWSSG